jgi:ribosome-associated protein
MSIQDSIKKELTFKTSRSSGPGGQHVNKTSSRVEVIFDLAATTLFTEEEKQLLTQKLASQLDSKGCIHVVSQANRSQLRNKTEAITRLTTLLLNALIKPKKRKPTKPSRGMIERRLKQKKVRSDIKKSRGHWGND